MGWDLVYLPCVTAIGRSFAEMPTYLDHPRLLLATLNRSVMISRAFAPHLRGRSRIAFSGLKGLRRDFLGSGSLLAQSRSGSSWPASKMTVVAFITDSKTENGVELSELVKAPNVAESLSSNNCIQAYWGGKIQQIETCCLFPTQTIQPTNNLSTSHTKPKSPPRNQPQHTYPKKPNQNLPGSFAMFYLGASLGFLGTPWKTSNRAESAWKMWRCWC